MKFDIFKGNVANSVWDTNAFISLINNQSSTYSSTPYCFMPSATAELSALNASVTQSINNNHFRSKQTTANM